MQRLFILTGLPYAGKSVLARVLVERFGFERAGVDDEITSGAYDVTTMSMRDWGVVYSRAYDRLEELLRAGGTVVWDGASSTRHNRDTLRKLAAEAGAEPVLVYVDTPAAETAERRRRNLTTGERAHLADETVREALRQFEEPAADEAPIRYNAAMDLDAWLRDNVGLAADH